MKTLDELKPLMNGSYEDKREALSYGYDEITKLGQQDDSTEIKKWANFVHTNQGLVPAKVEPEYQRAKDERDKSKKRSILSLVFSSVMLLVFMAGCFVPALTGMILLSVILFTIGLIGVGIGLYYWSKIAINYEDKCNQYYQQVKNIRNKSKDFQKYVADTSFNL